jgi:HrpA-like RNA helicase
MSDKDVRSGVPLTNLDQPLFDGAEATKRDLVDDETLYDFYEQRIPDDVVSGAHFDAWWKRARHDQPDLLDLRVTAS